MSNKAQTTTVRVAISGRAVTSAPVVVSAVTLTLLLPYSRHGLCALLRRRGKLHVYTCTLASKLEFAVTPKFAVLRENSSTWYCVFCLRTWYTVY